MRKCIVLLSGGLDSATTLVFAKKSGFDPISLFFRYGQKHAIEEESAKNLADHVNSPLTAIELPRIRGSALTGDEEVPKDRDPARSGIPPTYVPARNLQFLAITTSLAEQRDIRNVFIGVNAIDYSGYPDCRPEFIESFEALANASTRMFQFKILAPFIHFTKAEIILLGTALGVPYHLTHSCYDPVGELACGHCDSCQIRRAGFNTAQIEDPTRYAQ